MTVHGRSLMSGFSVLPRYSPSRNYSAALGRDNVSLMRSSNGLVRPLSSHVQCLLGSDVTSLNFYSGRPSL